MDEVEWEKRVSNLLKGQLKTKGVTYAQLVEKLEAIGVEEKKPTSRISFLGANSQRYFWCNVWKRLAQKHYV